MLLDGIRVIEAATFIAGPAAAMILGEFGADVVKIEPPDGDPFRQSVGAPGNPPTPFNYPFNMDNRHKGSVVLDLKQNGDRVRLYDMVGEADVFITNSPLGTRARLGIRDEDLLPLNERLIYASVTAYGETGPEAARTGFDSTALWARSGLMDMVRPAPDAPPARSLPGMGDHPTAMTLFAAVMMALYRRERTGKGGAVSTNLMANGLWWNAFQTSAILCGAEHKRRPSREDAANALHNLYRCGDGRWFHLVLLPEDRNWPKLVAALGKPEWLDDLRYRDRPARVANRHALIADLDAVFAARDWPEWREILIRHAVSFGEIGTLADIPNDAQMRESGALIPCDDPETGASLALAVPLFLKGEDRRKPKAGPELGSS